MNNDQKAEHRTKLAIRHVRYTLTSNGVFTGTISQWWHIGPLLVQLEEVKEVKFTDRFPFTQYGRYAWRLTEYFGDATMPSFLPCEWWEPGRPIVHYTTRQDALADASRQAIAWAKKEVGL